MSKPISRTKRHYQLTDYDDDGYDLMRELAEQAPAAEHPLDQAMRTNDQALRCYYEEHGEKATKANWSGLDTRTRATYERLPIISGTGLPSGVFFMRTYEGKVHEIRDTKAREHPMFAFQAR